MEMKVGTRVLMTIFLIVIILLLLFVILSIGGFEQNILMDAVNTMLNGGTGYKILYAAIAAVLIIVALVIMFFGAKKATPKTANVAVFESGSILITVKAIEELVERYVRAQHDIKGLRTQVISFGDAIDIGIEINVMPEVDIPELTQTLQDGLVGNIQQHTGLGVRKTKILVMGVDDKIRPKGLI